MIYPGKSLPSNLPPKNNPIETAGLK